MAFLIMMMKVVAKGDKKPLLNHENVGFHPAAVLKLYGFTLLHQQKMAGASHPEMLYLQLNC